jgi:hypothetical protein
MYGLRSAIALVVVLGVLSYPAKGSRISEASMGRIDGSIDCQAHASTGLTSIDHHRPGDVAHFTQFRYRMKSVLGESTTSRTDESDLGPAVVPSRLTSISPLEFTSRRHITVHPLRC